MAGDCKDEVAPAVARAASRRRTHARSDWDLIADGAKEAKDISLAGGPLTFQEMTVKHAAKLELAAPLVVGITSGAVTCKYEESKTSIKASWPPKYQGSAKEKEKEKEEFPFLEDTANPLVTLKMKGEKGNEKSCAKTLEVGLEAWLGPLGEEFEADLT